MNIEVHLQRIINGKTSYNLAGIVPNIEVDRYEEVINHPEVQEMIRKASGRHFNLTMYATIIKDKKETLEVTDMEIFKPKNKVL